MGEEMGMSSIFGGFQVRHQAVAYGALIGVAYVRAAFLGVVGNA
jgi:hypothetical protein